MPITENVSYFRPGDEVTSYVTADVVANTLVKIVSGGTPTRPHIAPAVAGDRVFGIAGRSGAEGDHIRVVREGIAPVLAGSAIEANALVYAGADSKAVAAGDTNPIGYAIADVESDGYAPVALSL